MNEWMKIIYSNRYGFFDEFNLFIFFNIHPPEYNAKWKIVQCNEDDDDEVQNNNDNNNRRTKKNP